MANRFIVQLIMKNIKTVTGLVCEREAWYEMFLEKLCNATVLNAGTSNSQNSRIHSRLRQIHRWPAPTSPLLRKLLTKELHLQKLLKARKCTTQ